MSGQSPLSMMHEERQAAVPPRRVRSAPRRRRRLWPIAVPFAVIGLAVLWCGLWYYAAAVASRTLAGWVQREAAAGRIYTCSSEDISGFPFRIEARCAQAAAALSSNQPPFDVAAKEITFVAQVYRPTTLVGQVAGPLTVAEPGHAPAFVATWKIARASVSGLPPNPDSLSIKLDHPHLDRGAGLSATPWLSADDAELDSRIVAGTAANHPVIDTTLHLTAATAPSVHPALVKPIQGDAEIVVRGFKDLLPKPMAERFREMQMAGGNIELKSVRVENADSIVVATGTLNVNEHGRLDGVLSIAVAGIDALVPLLGIDKMIDQGINRLTGGSGDPGQGFAALDRLVPGLGGVVRQGASASVIDNLKKMGQQTEIDKKPAIVLPLRFSDGAVYFGIIRVGEVPPLF